ncbi:Conidial pigment polyketide synthase alb1 [Lachnellula arida]|uniref:Conidial pigment polyketide synthase alb1 n=1 Tax=Lachnellula arida TaxID=1316785 RepID=A0A8T9BN59_9HELO|nr:Conidial pigment polyketide synthase alb1 [Lachnellula arida]
MDKSTQSTPVRTIILFGDLTYGFQQDLKCLLHIKDNANLLDFFNRVSLELRRECTLLTQREQDWLPRFTNLIDLVHNMDTAEGVPVIRFAMLCVYQIGRFIRHFGKPTAVYPRSDETYLLGICAGSFTAAAISTSQSIIELIPAGVEAVIQAFRTGLHSFKLQLELEVSGCTTLRSCSAVVSLSEQRVAALIEDYFSKSGIPKRYRPFITAVSPASVTVSGKPRILESLLGSATPQTHFLPIETLFHAPHLFGADDIDEIARTQGDEDLGIYNARIPIISPVSGALVQEGSLGATLRQAIHDTLSEQIRWDKIIVSCKELTSQDTTFQEYLILPCASNAGLLISSGIRSLEGRGSSISDVLNNRLDKAQPSKPTGRLRDSKIAVVGFSGRFPDAASNDEFWQVLRSGKDTHRTIPKDRYDWEAHFDPSGEAKNTSRVKYGCFIDKPGMFDAPFFHLSPKEAQDTDPAQRLALMTTYEALEMAGFVPDRTPSTQRDRVGVFFGTTSDDWREVNSGQDIGTYFIPGGNRAFIPGRITYVFRFSGPSISVDTACSSSFAALHTACHSLWQGGCDTAVAGGTNILTNPDNFAGLDRGHFLSTTGNCNAFDDEASGYCRADAVACVVLKRLEDAEADNDPVFGVIAGVDTNHCGSTESITRPHEDDQLSLFKRILQRSNTNPNEVSYVEMHGTGTQAGDAAEMSSVLAAVVPDGERKSRQALYLGATKANVGHAESASGVSGLIKVLMMLRHDEIPPHVGIKTRINRNYPLDLAKRNVHIAMQPTPWRKDHILSGKRVILLNNFSAAGGNTAVLLEDAPGSQRDDSDVDPRGLHLVVLTANNPKSLKANMSALLVYLDNNPHISLPALSYTTTSRRPHHKFRVASLGNDIDSIKDNLRLQLEQSEDVSAFQIAKKQPQTCFVFTGQGTFYDGLGKQLFETIGSFREHILRFDQISRQHGFPSFLSFMTSEPCEAGAEEAEIVTTHVALVCVQMALYHLWISWGILPSCITGHSLGEYASFYAAGILSASDVIYLVGIRANLLLLHCVKGSHPMLSVKASVPAIHHIISASSCEIACINSPTSTVLSGPSQEIGIVARIIRSESLDCVPLALPYGFHSRQVEPLIEEFAIKASKLEYQAPQVPYISPLLSRAVSAGEAGVLDGAYLSRACRAPVDFCGAIEVARSAGVVCEKTKWLELGVHPVCSSFIKQIMGSTAATIPSLRRAVDSWETMVPAVQAFYLEGHRIEWNEYHRDFATSHRVLSLPSYRWDLKNYWITYRGNFCLHKGDDDVPLPPKPYLSSSVHRTLEECHGTEQSTLLAESELHDLRLYPILEGHKVNGVAICPSSLYADIALTVGRYLLEGNGRLVDGGLNCADMQIDRPFISSPDSNSQLLRVSATADWPRGEILLKFFSVDAQLKKLTDHAVCTIKTALTSSTVWLSDWQRLNHLIQSRITSLRRGVDDGASHRLKRGLIYKLFGSLVDYGNCYQGIQEVILDADALEATARVSFQVRDEGFLFNPCWIDSLGHIAGFIMNGTNSLELKNSVFVNSGNERGDMYVGDTYILQDSTIIGIVEGVKRVPKSILGHLLPSQPRLHSEELRQHPAQKPSMASPQLKVAQVPLSKQQNLPVLAKNATGTLFKSIVCQEAGIDIAELSSDTAFADLGIDSLLSLDISSRLQKELGLDVTASSFIAFPTLNEMLNYVAPPDPSSSPVFDDSTQISNEDDDLGNETEITSADARFEVMRTIRAAIAEAVGIPLQDLTASTNLAELGVDSLLSLDKIGELQKLGVDDPLKLFQPHFSLQEIENTLFPKPSVTLHQVVAKDKIPDLFPLTTLDEGPYATSVRLQGSPSNARKNLFLFPDGAGSASSYMSLPEISSNVVVYGLTCPWLKTPQDLRCSLPQYVSKFITEITRIQPNGPYSFAGWSAGGILAYEAAQQLALSSQKIAHLIIFDTPNPVGIQSPPEHMYDFLESLGMFGLPGRQPPSWLRPHFRAFIAMLDKYQPVPFKGKTVPTTRLIYARDGLCKTSGDPRPDEQLDDTREMKWLLNNRTDFSGAGWRDLLGEQNLEVDVINDTNHYDMLTKAESAMMASQLVRGYLS